MNRIKKRVKTLHFPEPLATTRRLERLVGGRLLNMILMAGTMMHDLANCKHIRCWSGAWKNDKNGTGKWEWKWAFLQNQRVCSIFQKWPFSGSFWSHFEVHFWKMRFKMRSKWAENERKMATVNNPILLVISPFYLFYFLSRILAVSHVVSHSER